MGERGRGQARDLEGVTDNSRRVSPGEAYKGPPAHGLSPPAPVTERKREEMAKCLLGLKLPNHIKWDVHTLAPMLPSIWPLGHSTICQK